MEALFQSEYSIMWTAVGSIAQGVASILAMAALLYSMTTFRKSLKLSHYAELDRMYFDLLKVGLENPALTDPKAVKTEREKAQYEAYAFMVWNFLETIYDRCGADEYLCSTWYPIIQGEASLHKDWFDKPENLKKFKQTFRQFAHERFK